jgi:hypothetical protein
LHKDLPGIDTQTIVMAGATGVRDIVSADQLPLVLEAYNMAVRNVFIMGVALGGLAFVAAWFFENKNIKGKNLLAAAAEAA